MFPRKLGFFPYVWLVYMLIPIFNMAFEAGFKRVLGYALIILFTLAYRQLFFAVRSSPYLLALQMVILVILSWLYLPFYLFMGFFTAYSIGAYGDKRKFFTALAAFIVSILLPIALNADQLTMQDYLTLTPFILVMIMSPFGVRSMNTRRQLEFELNQAKEQIKDLVKREERIRIARDLHDTLGHTLSLITLKSQLVHRLIDKDPQKAQLETREIEHTSRAALRQVRELVSDMRTITLAEVLAEVRAILQSAEIAFTFKGDTRMHGVPDLTQNILSMCLKEAVTNIIKHSRATSCTVTIEQTPSEVRMRIDDNGIGLTSDAEPDQGNGLKGITERLSLIEGSMTVSSLQGVTLSIIVPIIIKEKKESDTA